MKKNIKELSKTLRECRKALNEKSFKDLSFKDLIAPFINLLNQIHSAKDNSELDLPPLEDDKVDINKVLSTSEKDLNNDGSFTEAYYKKTNSLLLTEERTRKEILKDYIKQGGQKTLRSWREYVDSGKLPEEDRRRVAAIGPNFYMIYDAAKAELESEGTEISTSSPSEFSTSTPIEDLNYKPSENLQNLVDITQAAGDIQESAVTTVADKYDTIELLLRRVIRGKSTKRYYLLAGDPGIGKTYEVEKLLKEEGLEGKVPTCTGSIGRSPTSMAIFLWTHRNDELVILDDCDSFLRKGGNIDVVNILKGCMEPGTHYKVGIPQNIANIATKQLKKSKEESKVSDKVRALFEGKDTFSYSGYNSDLNEEINQYIDNIIITWEDNTRESGNKNPDMSWVKFFKKQAKAYLLKQESSNPGIVYFVNHYDDDDETTSSLDVEGLPYSDADMDDVYEKVYSMMPSYDGESIASEEEDSNWEDEDDSELETDDKIPTSWTFNARLIILSNLHESQIEEALWSRCDHYDLHLTQEEYLVRLGMILDDMDVGQKDGLCTEEEATEAKALTLSVMSAVIEAGNHGVQLYGKYIRLTNHLEFRIVKDLCNMWLALLDRELELHPGEDRDEAKKKVMNKWVRIGVIPRLSVSTKL